MKALCWHGKSDVRCDEVPDPIIEHPRDAIVRVTSCAICGSDLHLYDGVMAGMEKGDILGHEFMGEVVEVGADIKSLRVGDRVVVPFTIACGECDQCRRSNYSVCERSNRTSEAAAAIFGHATGGLFGYTHLTGGYPGGQAEYVRVPFADFGPVRVPDELSDEQVLFLGDILPTAWQAVIQCHLTPADTVAIWGAGPVGQLCIRSALILGARKVVAIDRVPERLALARAAGALAIDFQTENVVEALAALTDGKGPEKCIDAVGMEAHGTTTLADMYERARQAVLPAVDRPHVLREMIHVCRPAGTLSVPGVYAGYVDQFPFGAVMNKGLTIRTGQTHVNRWTDDLLKRILDGQIDPTFMITHRARLADGPALYQTFRDKADGCIKVVLRP